MSNDLLSICPQCMQTVEACKGNHPALSTNHPNRSKERLTPTQRLVKQAWKSAYVFAREDATPSQVLTAQRQLVNEVRRYIQNT